MKYLLALSLLALSIQAVSAATVTAEPYGKTAAGQTVTEYTFKNNNGMTVKILDIAGAIREINVPDAKGQMANVVLGLPNAEAYATQNDPHFGAIVGRYANRIAKGQFTLNGKQYQLPLNNGENTLHGGPSTYAQDLWQSKILKQKKGSDTASVEMTYLSPNGQNGFPGNVKTTVVYSLNEQNELTAEYKATTDQDTVVNLTNHSYFNLAGEGSGSVEKQQIQILASKYTPTDAGSIPTGELASVEGTPFDLRQMTPIGQQLRNNHPQMVMAHGYDHNWVLDNYDAKSKQPKLAVKALDPESGRTLEVHTTEPGVQFYTSNFLDGSVVGTSGKAYRQTEAFALEAEHFPDSPNQPSFPSTVLKKGQTFQATTVYKFGVNK
ncbi:aldose epimerase family protein [Acinetobacter lanii]|uniref:Aldose 1-epimerase n=1 Tax=Acinetobacter lanii TaxID=2715163 RepID=A0A6G8S368_9GAMM|nr:aldose epimerase family protein [Acinetobacter lanii]QIO08597.1 galactose mutarotase [Acinetobacter lanii]